jgi:penicillin-binding protein 1A
LEDSLRLDASENGGEAASSTVPELGKSGPDAETHPDATGSWSPEEELRQPDLVEDPTIVDEPTDEFKVQTQQATPVLESETPVLESEEGAATAPKIVSPGPMHASSFLPDPAALAEEETAELPIPELPKPAASESPAAITPSGEPPLLATEETAALPTADSSPGKAAPKQKTGWSGASAFDRKKRKVKRERSKRKSRSKQITVGQRVLRTLKWVAIIGLVIGLLGVLAIGGVVGYYAQQVPDVDVLGTYSPPTVTQVRSADGVLLGEFFEQQRYVTPIEDIPKNLQNAFVSAEDAAFWEHQGLDYLGIIRAALKNLEEGRMAQGASTITQQVARSFLLTREKKLDRKLKEAVLAHKIENNFEKDYILYLYLNQIFLGHGAYGVQAASRLYFDKDVKDLTLAECAIIAGLPQAPSRYSPNKNFQKAKQRQSYVLDQMVDKGYISREEADAAFAEKLVFKRKHNKNLVVAPYYVEHVRKYLNQKYGEGVVNREGLQVVVPLDVGLQNAGVQAVKDGVRRSDKIMGYRGPIAKLETEGDILKKKQKLDRERTLKALPYNPAFKLPEGAVAQSLIPPLVEGEITQGVVAQVGRTWAVVDVGSHRGVLPVSEFPWCHKVNPERNFRYFTCKSLDDTLFPGDVIEVRVVDPEENWKRTLGSSWKGSTTFARLAMEQPPLPQAALLSLRVSDGAIISMVGGKDYIGSEFNRAMQAKRQMGSTVKPFCYTAALDHPKAKLTPSSIFLDAPIVEESRGKEGKIWAPKNAGGGFEGETTLRRGLMLSRNTVTLKILQATGVGYTVDYLARFGFEFNPNEANQSMCLGTASRTLLEIAEAYTVFPTLGDRRSSYFVSEVRDRNGTVLEARTEGELERDVIDDGTAYQMVRLMRDVVQSGTARKAMELGVPLSGKTGTTNDFRDAWFVGYTPEVVTIAWVGLDNSETMGQGQYGGDVALPIWMDYMEEAIEEYPPTKYQQPEDIVMTLVDSKTGLLVRKGELGAWAAFKKGSEPTEFTPAPDAVDTASFLTGEF